MTSVNMVYIVEIGQKVVRESKDQNTLSRVYSTWEKALEGVRSHCKVYKHDMELVELKLKRWDLFKRFNSLIVEPTEDTKKSSWLNGGAYFIIVTTSELDED